MRCVDIADAMSWIARGLQNRGMSSVGSIKVVVTKQFCDTCLVALKMMRVWFFYFSIINYGM